MGGGNSSNYSIERFIREYCENNYDIQDVQKSVLSEKLEALLQVFNNNVDAYKDYKKLRKEIDEKEGKKDINYDNEATKFEAKNQKYSSCISFCIQINRIFILNYSDLYAITLKIMSFLSKLELILVIEIDFIKVFMAISTDKVSNIISTKEMKYDELVYIEISK